MFTDENLAKAEALAKFATSRRHSLLELAISWLASRPAVASIIAGAKTAAQATANAAASGWELSEAELVEIARLL
jgi:aryl-alcohol dehydrogenase-like predicted oxidoreductase